ncbi:MAG: LacI family DNA-binding transcriptional regulator [Christensenellales bacterium]|jgi:LacI family repressor for deo operon, udp, cdd, tsx, nupC, and nupG
MPTISDVAKLAGVSVATVSRVINDHGNVLPATEEAVRNAIAALHYSPNSMGRNLRQLKTNRILVLQPSITNPFYSHVVRGIDAAAHQEGYHIMLSDTNSDPERERQYLSMLESHVADGAILTTPCFEPEHYREFAKKHPILFCTEDYDDSTISCVTIDNRQAGYDVANYLISIGHRRIAFLGIYGNRLVVSQRLEGFRRALNEAGIPFPREYLLEGNAVNAELEWVEAEEVAQSVVALPKLPTAMFCTSDAIGVWAIKGLKKTGLRVPEDISVFTFDDIDLAKQYDPTLTTVYFPKYEMGRKAVEVLLERIRNPACKARRVVLKHELRVRESTRPLAGSMN